MEFVIFEFDLDVLYIGCLTKTGTCISTYVFAEVRI